MDWPKPILGEKPRATEIEFNTEEGRVVWRRKFSDGGADKEWTKTELQASDPARFEALKRSLEEKFGIRNDLN